MEIAISFERASEQVMWPICRTGQLSRRPPRQHRLWPRIRQSPQKRLDGDLQIQAVSPMYLAVRDAIICTAQHPFGSVASAPVDGLHNGFCERLSRARLSLRSPALHPKSLRQSFRCGGSRAKVTLDRQAGRVEEKESAEFSTKPKGVRENPHYPVHGWPHPFWTRRNAKLSSAIVVCSFHFS